MTDRNDQQLDEMLRRHLATELDPHLGQSAARFARQFSAAPRSRFLRLWPLSAAAVAATIALALCMLPLRPAPPQQSPLGPPDPVVNTLGQFPDVGCTVFSRTFDDGAFLTDEQIPVRRFRRHTVQTLEWFDPRQQARIRISRPGEQIICVGLQTY
jgi:hypothetical protein